MRISIRLFIALLILLAGGCAKHEHTPIADETGAICPLPLPATYVADIPCRDCPPTTAALTLRPDSLYFLRVKTVQPDTGAETVKAEIGVWKYVSSGNTILLATYDNVARTLHITPTNKLRVIKVSGGIIPPDVNYDLSRDDSNPGYNDVVPVQGMYSYMADAGLFTECLSGARFPVAMEAQNAALERAYLNTPHGQAEPVLVSLEARLTTRPRYGGVGYEEAVVPVRFINIQPGIACTGEKSSKLRLVDNSWRLIELDGKPIELSEDQKNPFVHLQTKDNRMQGFAGCNRFSGTYLVKGSIFLFNKMIRSRMACVDGIEMEENFFRALSATDGYHINGDILELRDRSGKVLARLRHAGGS
ncbi:MAG: META domain-containing protein [Thermodesulfobacteriota bacterium]|nr:META domain-containing protein [Thermodesulfobacteriota bacterium]